MSHDIHPTAYIHAAVLDGCGRAVLGAGVRISALARIHCDTLILGARLLGEAKSLERVGAGDLDQPGQQVVGGPLHAARPGEHVQSPVGRAVPAPHGLVGEVEVERDVGVLHRHRRYLPVTAASRGAVWEGKLIQSLAGSPQDG